ncbi:CGNR zinc finger domain-containing protein [Streptosporangium sp. CA-135522]|uniref:CGNR zinc finger domain-containing protein n=1 Tax=Streptosporangium sp. CA-135522 TaxID=3240072 RepID=UPI003D8AADF8
MSRFAQLAFTESVQAHQKAHGSDRAYRRMLNGSVEADLRACHAPGCVLFFVKDHHRREWCSAACGNRARAARHYSQTHTR